MEKFSYSFSTCFIDDEEREETRMGILKREVKRRDHPPGSGGTQVRELETFPCLGNLYMGHDANEGGKYVAEGRMIR